MDIVSECKWAGGLSDMLHIFSTLRLRQSSPGLRQDMNPVAGEVTSNISHDYAGTEGLAISLLADGGPPSMVREIRKM